jgi:hypothetical protein
MQAKRIEMRQLALLQNDSGKIDGCGKTYFPAVGASEKKRENRYGLDGRLLSGFTAYLMA